MKKETRIRSRIHRKPDRTDFPALCLAICASLLLTACGEGGGAGGGTGTGDASAGDNPSPATSLAKEQGYVYLPEAVTIEDERADYGNMQLIGDSLYYLTRNGEEESGTRNIFRYSISTQALTVVPLDWQTDSDLWEPGFYTFEQDYSMWLTVNAYSADYSQLRRFLCRFDGEGRNLVSQEITGQLEKDTSIRGLATDSQGRVCVFTDNAGIWLYTADGSFLGNAPYSPSGNGQAEGNAQVQEDIQVKGSFNDEDGSFYVCIWKMQDTPSLQEQSSIGKGHSGEPPERCSLMEVDFEKKQLVEIVADFPNIRGLCPESHQTAKATQPEENPNDKDTAPTSNGDNPSGGSDAGSSGQYDLLLYDESFVYGYDLPTQGDGSPQAPEALFAWTDSDVNGYFVEGFGVLEDGRYLAVVEDWEHDDLGLILLSRTKTEDAPERIPLVLATVNGSSDLAALAVKFNKGNARYHLTVKSYGSLSDLYNAILAKESPDLIDLSGIDGEKLARQDVLEDLRPYLEQSQEFGPSAFVDGILDAYTFGGTLIGVPETFALQTVVGDGAQPENENGLTLEGLRSIAGRNPGTLPFDGIARDEMMQYLMMFNQDAFIDWEAGECHFDSEAFRAILDLCKSLPDNAAPGSEGAGEEISLPRKIQNGQVLFAIADVDEPRALQPYGEIFGQAAACLGFPTMDGQGGTLLYAENAYGICAGSEHKDGAWEFIQGILGRESADSLPILGGGFPALKKELDKLIHARMEEDSQYPGDRFPSIIYEDGWEFQYHALTQDEVDEILSLVKEAIPAFSVQDDDVIKIISEEANLYYSGQKSAEDVVSVIQNRVQNFVSENR